MTVLGWLMLGGWVLFWVYWLVSAVGAKKNARPAIGRFVGLRIVIFVLAVAVVHAVTAAGYTIGGPNFGRDSGVVAGVGLVLFLGGLALAVWARVYLGRNWGMPMTLKQDPELVTGGPYRTIRHPIYSGILLAILGCALTGSLYFLIVLIVFGIYFGYSAYAEEKLMLGQFPKTYPAYRARTKMLVPWVL